MNNPSLPGSVERIVLDTNIFISAALKADSPPRLAFRWVVRHAVLLKSAETEAELFRTLMRPKFAPLVNNEFAYRMREAFQAAELVEIVEHVQACRDSNDDKFLELAINGRADMIVSGDTDLLLMAMFRGIPILSPAAFVRGSVR